VLRIGDQGLSGVGQVLFLGAHSDDIEIGCGGTILTLIEACPDVEIVWVVLSASGEREAEARRSASRFLSEASTSVVRIEGFRERYLPYIASDVKEVFDGLGNEVSPDLVFAPSSDDRHQDHRLIAELAENTFRDHLILNYEIPKYDGDLTTPNVYFRLSEDSIDRKVAYLLEEFPSQQNRHWFTEETFRSLSRIRGIESKAPSGFAEGFHCRKMVIS
jgi:LmbE family N-acetylglucosaminyl deacetylase